MMANTEPTLPFESEIAPQAAPSPDNATPPDHSKDKIMRRLLGKFEKIFDLLRFGSTNEQIAEVFKVPVQEIERKVDVLFSDLKVEDRAAFNEKYAVPLTIEDAYACLSVKQRLYFKLLLKGQSTAEMAKNTDIAQHAAIVMAQAIRDRLHTPTQQMFEKWKRWVNEKSKAAQATIASQENLDLPPDEAVPDVIPTPELEAAPDDAPASEPEVTTEVIIETPDVAPEPQVQEEVREGVGVEEVKIPAEESAPEEIPAAPTEVRKAAPLPLSAGFLISTEPAPTAPPVDATQTSADTPKAPHANQVAIDKFCAGLTPRERLFFDWAVEGLSNAEMAKKAGISEGTVKETNRGIYAKADVENRNDLLLKLKLKKAPPKPAKKYRARGDAGATDPKATLPPSQNKRTFVSAVSSPPKAAPVAKPPEAAPVKKPLTKDEIAAIQTKLNTLPPQVLYVAARAKAGDSLQQISIKFGGNETLVADIAGRIRRTLGLPGDGTSVIKQVHEYLVQSGIDVYASQSATGPENPAPTKR